MMLPPQNFGAYEMKFILPDDQVQPVIDWARGHLPPDTNAEVPGDDQYSVHSLYFDTSDLSVFHRRPDFREQKYRIRRYGREERLFLEEKAKVRGWVRKRRTVIAPDELNRILVDEGEWEGAWFARIIRENCLLPQTRVSYRRIARVGEAEGGPVRMTIDRSVRCASALGLWMPRENEGAELERNILEIKFGQGLPLLFKSLIAEFGLQASSSSKYRLSVLQTGRATPEVLLR